MAYEVKTSDSTDPLEKYVCDNSLRLHPAQRELHEFTKTLPDAVMLSDPLELQMIQLMAKSIQAKKALDIGVYTGYSALSLALALPPDGTVIACDVDDKRPAEGRKYWKQAGVENKIDLRIGPAKATLEGLLADGLAGTFDVAFIDADKTSYDDYYELSLALLRPGGLIFVDNMLCMGGVLTGSNEIFTEKSVTAMTTLIKKIQSDDRVDQVTLKLGDGTAFVLKR